ncbi:MAG TPA: hypothetical protein DCS93_22360 [Microscillaceae bacterium]|nr:hypothetical protein [Microscillaceae bacterium]
MKKLANTYEQSHYFRQKIMDKSTVLLVDDDKENLQTLSIYLKKREKDYRVLSAPNGQIAAKIMQKDAPDIIITDWDMPLMNGIELIKYVKSNPILAEIPVIIITGINISPEYLKTAFDAGAYDYITKPISYLELYARTDSALGIYHALRTIKKQNRLIEEQKNRELSTKMMEIAQKNQVMMGIQKNIRTLASKLAGSLKKEALQIDKDIDLNLTKTSQWEMFKVQFENIHQNFFERLQKYCPKLSQIDLRHCAYIKLGLSNPEIADIIGISQTSVVTQHYRIKKKLNLATEVKLAEFIYQV